jgi:flap endonuclease-1
MGIKGLGQLLASKNIFARIISLAKFAGYQVAIDANGWAFASYVKSYTKVAASSDIEVTLDGPDPIIVRNEWFKYVLSFIERWLKQRIIPIFVFDGEPREEKAITRQTRKDNHQKSLTEIEQGRKELEGKSILERTGGEYEEKMNRFKKKVIDTPKVSYKDLKCLRKFLDAFGLPWYQAKHDAEQLCAILVTEGECIAALSKDWDLGVFGCPRTLQANQKRSEKGEDDISYETYSCWYLEDILKGLGLTQEQFVDMCILAGCDYNRQEKDRSPIPDISINRAYALVKEYGQLENIPQNRPGYIDRDQLTHLPSFRSAPKHKYPMASLKIEACRRIFSYHASNLGKEGGFAVQGHDGLREINYDKLTQLRAAYNLSVSFDGVIRAKDKTSAPQLLPHAPFHILSLPPLPPSSEE